MFGWEFPPHILGGLGTACYGLTKGLSLQNDLQMTFVLPKPQGDEDQSFMKISLRESRLRIFVPAIRK